MGTGSGLGTVVDHMASTVAVVVLWTVVDRTVSIVAAVL